MSEERIGNRELLLLKKQKEEMLIRTIKMKRLKGSLQLADKKKLERKAAKWRELTVSLSAEAKCRIFCEIQMKVPEKRVKSVKSVIGGELKPDGNQRCERLVEAYEVVEVNTSDVSSTKPYSDIGNRALLDGVSILRESLKDEVRTLNAGKGRDDEHLTLELNENVTEDNSDKVTVTLVKSDKIEVTTDKKSKGITDNVTIDKKLTGVTKSQLKLSHLKL